MNAESIGQQQTPAAHDPPIQRIPWEIMEEIFSRCSPHYVDMIQMRYAPWVLTRVCSDWRTIVLSCPRLWSTISIRPAKYENREEGALFMLYACLDNSGTHPLEICFHAGVEHALNAQFMRPLVAQCRRWRHVTMKITHGLLPELNPVRGCLPLLEFLAISGDSPGSGWPTIDLFDVAPRLRTITVELSPCISMRLPWAQLLECVMTHCGDPLHVLEVAPNLLIHRIHPSQQRYRTPRSTVRHENLVSLLLHDNTLLNHLVLPSLEKLVITSSIQPQTLLTIISFILQSSCRLRTFAVLGLGSAGAAPNTEQPGVLEFLQCVPDIAELDLVFRRTTDVTMITEFIHWLTVSPTRCFAPSLVRFALRFDNRPINFNFTPVVEMLESRGFPCDWITRLKQVHLHFQGSCDNGPLLARIQTLGQLGMEVHTNHIYYPH